MSQKPSLTFRKDSADRLMERYFRVTTLRFDPEMGARLMKFRKIMNLTQRKLAEQLGLNQTDIARLEKGKNITAAPHVGLFKSVLGKYFEDVVFDGPFLDLSKVSPSYNRQIKRWVT